MAKTMRLIQSVKYIEVNRDPYEIASATPPGYQVQVNTGEGPRFEDVCVLTELIHGRRFVDPLSGTEVVLGVAKEVQELIGLQYDAYETLEKEVQTWVACSSRLRAEVNRLKAAGFWSRIKWVFTGIPARTL